MNLILFGFKGSGKTYFGRCISQKMNLPFIDTDDLVIDLFLKKNKKKASIEEIYLEEGSFRFRALEKKAVFSLSTVKNTVIALGGGAVLEADNVRLLKEIGSLIYLFVEFQVITSRIKKEAAFLAGRNVLEVFLERQAIYEAASCIKIDCTGVEEEKIIEKLCVNMLENGNRKSQNLCRPC